MKVTSTRTVEVEGIAKLWWPMVPVAFRRTYKVGKGPWQKEIGSLEDAEQVLMTDCGDFSSIDDYRIYYVVTRSYRRDGVVGSIFHTRVKVAREWQRPDSEEQFADALFGGEDESAVRGELEN